jgi:hypothetical protein
MRAVNIIAVATMLGAASSVAAQGSLSPKPGGAFTPVPQQSRPLFQNDQLNKLQEEARRQLESRRPKVVCGMNIAPADPAIDPKLIKKAPTDKKYTMRLVPPGICSQDSSNAPTVVVPRPTVAPR